MVLAIIFLARICVGFQFIAVAAQMPQLRADLHFDYSQIGILLGVFMIAGAFLSLPSGMIANRLGDRRTIQIGLVALVVGGGILGSGDSFYGALIGRIIGGFGAVFITVPAAKILTDWFVGKETATAMSVLGVAWPVGIALGMSLLPFINAWFDWRVAVYVTAAVPALAIVLVALLPTPVGTTESAPENSVTRSPLWSIDRRELWIILAGGFAWPLMSTGGYVVFSSYAPVLLIDRGIPHTSAALAISVLSWLLIVIIPLGGYLADRTGKKDQMFWGGCLVAAAAIAMVPVMDPVEPWVILSAILGFTVGMVMALPGDMLSPKSRATGLGLYYTMYYIGKGI
ncbi:MAG: MFS transporter, partial [Rhodospirillales bacterium]|nr:MFS transporter [Rhodospirillales bacterium]